MEIDGTKRDLENILKDRYGHNHNNGTGEPRWSRVTYLAHAKGYVMARRPGRTPFVVTSEQWLDFPLWEKGPPSGKPGESLIDSPAPFPISSTVSDAACPVR